MTNTDPILAEQLAYYRARAREYDKWFRREGLHDLGEEHNARWRLELNRVYSALDAFAPRGDVLELAYGTGEWTIRLAESATRVVGVDADGRARDLVQGCYDSGRLQRIAAERRPGHAAEVVAMRTSRPVAT